MSHRRSRDDNHAADAGSRHSQRRPASIGELAEKALDIDWDPSRDFKHCLRMAERARNQARISLDQGDLEMAFMLFARAATIALDKLPTHSSYTTSLTELQRNNLGLNGQEILDHMSKIKPKLVTRFNEWRVEHPDDELVPLERLDRPAESRERDPERALADEAARWRQLGEERQRQDEQRPSVRHQHSSPQSQYPQQPTFPDRRKEEVISSARQASATPVYKSPVPDYSFSRPPNNAHGSQSTIVVMPGVTDGGESSARKREREEKRRFEAEGIARRQQEADAEARNIRQAIAVNNTLPHGPQIQNQSLSTHSSASSVATNGSSSMFPHTQVSSLATTPASSFYSQPQQQFPPPPLPVVQQPPQAQIPPVALTPVRGPPPPPMNHIHTPTLPDQHSGSEPPGSYFLIPGTSPADLNRTPTRATLRGNTTMTPITTTSPPPQDPRALFPSLMSPHQQRQGYYPSSSSMFILMDRLTLNDATNPPQPPPSNYPYNPNPHAMYGMTPVDTFAANASYPAPPNAVAGWAFGSQESTRSAAAAAAAQVAQRLMDGNGKLKKYNTPAPLPGQQGSVFGPLPPPPPPLHQQPPPLQQPEGNNPNMKLPYIPMPPPPLSALAAGNKIPIMPGPPPERRNSVNTPSSASNSNYSGSTNKERKLKTVVLPRETLPRFLAIAKLNTSMNRETCGLLLGREVWPEEESPPSYAHNPTTRGRKAGREMLNNATEGGVGKSEFVVTTLLIPKQRGTSDMCTMNEEELVLSFTEERSLITLGWIHTHPSQSCFMSSVDLHTHSGFQRMLPESVAVVCAPKSNPNFGIFRLTDPPGLDTILDCKEKEAFHPHPDLPIYTDADKGHVQMKDAPLEIVDLRS